METADANITRSRAKRLPPKQIAYPDPICALAVQAREAKKIARQAQIDGREDDAAIWAENARGLRAALAHTPAKTDTGRHVHRVEIASLIGELILDLTPAAREMGVYWKIGLLYALLERDEEADETNGAPLWRDVEREAKAALR